MRPQAVLYTSATGFTRQYAQMLSQATGLPACPPDGPDAPPRDTPVLFLGWLRAGTVQGLKEALGRWRVAAVCAVGMASPAEADVSRLARSSHLGDRPLFYLRGGYAPDRVKGLSKLMMTPILLSAKHAAAKGDPKAGALMEVLVHGVDWVSREQLQPVLDWLEQP